MSQIPECDFLPRTEAEALTPPPGYHLVSISDDIDDQARIDESRWESVSYHHFVDAGFDEEVLAIYGSDFEKHYVDYFLWAKAEDLRSRLSALAGARANLIINCHAGRSRSAAVAMYMQRHHGYLLRRPTPDANLCVYRMLAMDRELMTAYQTATSKEGPKPRRGLREWLGW